MYKHKSSVLYRRTPSHNHWWFYPSLMLGATTVMVLAIAAGYYWGSRTLPQEYVQQFREQLKNQWDELENTEVSVRADVDALTHRIGMLQAHVTRLNALGSKMVSMAKLKKGEFDFTEVPAMGGASEDLDEAGLESESITKVLEKLELALMEKEQQLQYLDEMMLSKNLQDEVKPKGKPVTDGWISSRYGYRTDPFNGRRQFHRGIDFAGAKGTPIYAAAGGVVVRARKLPQFGNLVEIDHRNGYVTRYAHTSKMLVKAGDVVKKGQKIAEMGSTGRSTGTHLHFEVIKNGATINPALILEKHKHTKNSSKSDKKG